ncbi:MAG: hypothetical protein A3J74_02390 [Elusimicrobia bacterium RIFCSPHIGHO2_02_FULL_57_9]|nr:MAG: hypothetical protein A3J74_02390 [Elusimicrobia bacterium RIFCSPHIGHO2_02_FULL_57_9]
MDIKEIEHLITPLLEQEGAELVDLKLAKEGPKWVLRIFLDKPGGITLDDCAYFSSRIGALLDSSDAMDTSYLLEISSPGLDRVIKKEKDFERFSGRAIRLRLKAPEAGQRNFKGKLLGLKEGKVAIECEGNMREFSAALIAELRLDYSAESERIL